MSTKQPKLTDMSRDLGIVVGSEKGKRPATGKEKIATEEVKLVRETETARRRRLGKRTEPKIAIEIVIAKARSENEVGSAIVTRREREHDLTINTFNIIDNNLACIFLTFRWYTES